ncbi:MAG: hypothetical protein OXD01_11445 [Gammaproteobacteria bacterium]|nr:hypothetical protein [Gammaproteobacteria bacterium]
MITKTKQNPDAATVMNLCDASPHSTSTNLGVYFANGRIRIGIEMMRRNDRRLAASTTFLNGAGCHQ